MDHLLRDAKVLSILLRAIFGLPPRRRGSVGERLVREALRTNKRRLKSKDSRRSIKASRGSSTQKTSPKKTAPSYRRKRNIPNLQKKVGTTNSVTPWKPAASRATANLAPPEEADWDQEQVKVINEAVDARLIVDAGPGTGKTAVACARLAHLIREEGLEPVNVLMISFTRTAVAEIRARLYSYVGSDAFAIRIATIDSHAWAIHSGHVPNARLTGSSYDENIERTVELLKTDENVWEELSLFEHVVIDEAQDILGLRAELVELLVARLSDNCGITVFADEAQAIYGFSTESDGRSRAEGGGGQPLLESLRVTDGLTFSRHSLSEIHRTSSPGLRRIFSDVRRDVLDPQKRKRELARQTAAWICEHADMTDLLWRNMKVETFDADTLILFRTRADVLMASQFCAVPHRLRLSGYGATLPSWLARCFFDFTDPFLDEEEFLRRWSNRVGNATGAGLDSAEAWLRIRKMAGKEGGLVDMIRLRQRLARGKPPVELATSEYGLHGPMIGTIHASKGREAPNVVLLLPEAARITAGDINKVAEEARVFFVGATRARECLGVGKSTTASKTSRTLTHGRVYRIAGNGKPMVEVGRPGDIYPRGLVGQDIFDERAARDAQAFLARVADEVACYSLKFEFSLNKRYAIVADDPANTLIGVVGRAFQRDLWKILERKGVNHTHKPANRIGPVRSMGCSTLVVEADSGELEGLHEPWASSGFMLAPRIAAFPPIRLFSR